jgi:hypothetical protein
MGTPIRTLIRAAIFAAVSDPLKVPSVNGRVHKGRYHGISEDALAAGPVIFVQAGDEELHERSEYPRPRAHLKRYANDVLIVAKNAGDVDALVDIVAMEVCAAVATDPSAGGVARDIEYQGINDYGEDEENLDIVKAPMRFVAEYATPENATDTPL